MNVTITDGTRTPVTVQTGSPVVVQPATGPVTSVNGDTGAVTIDTTTIGADPAGAAAAAEAAAIADAAATYLPLAGGTVTGNLAITGDINHAGITDWINAKTQHGATGNGSTDDTAAIQAALDTCPRGGTVYLPAGVYRTSAQLVLPPRVTLRSGHAPHWPQYAKDHTQISACIKALSGYAGTAMIRILDKAGGNWTEDYMSAARLIDITLDGGNFGTNVAGIYATGQCVDIGLTDVCINNMSGRGIYTDTLSALQPKGWQLTRVAVQSCGGSGYYHANTGGADFAVTDMSYDNCWSGVSGSDGWHFESALSVDLLGCRSEFNTGYGYYAAGNSRLRFVDCDTDRNTKSGWRLECQGSGTRSILLTGCVANRDGANDDITPAGYAGIDIVGSSGTAHNPVTVSGCIINVNHNDAGAGIYSPDYGLKMTYAPQVSATATFLNGTVAALLDSQKQIVFDNTTRHNTTNPSTGVVTLETANIQRINGAAGTNRDIEFWTTGSGKRWAARASSTTESGSEAGSNFNIVRYDDSGTVIDTPLSIARSTGVITATTGLAATGNALGVPQPRNHGAVAWSSDPTHNINASLLTNGTVYLTAVYPAATTSVTKVYFHITTVAVTPTSGRNEAGIYSSAGTLLQTVNVDSLITATGLVTATITSQSLTANTMYWVGLVFNAATAPTLARCGQQTGAAAVHNMGLTAATYRYATNGTGQNTLPASITPGSNSATAFAGPWVAVG